LPLPSSPHCAPTTTTEFISDLSYALHLMHLSQPPGTIWRMTLPSPSWREAMVGTRKQTAEQIVPVPSQWRKQSRL
jgi:hypothetical protein